jgi:hypothetical protein
MKKALLIGIAALFLATGAAHAVEMCAVVLKAPDGFLASRTKPGTRFEIQRKFAQGRVLGVETEEHCSHSVPGRLVCNKKWIHVKNIYPEFRDEEVEGFSSGFGYIYSKYIQTFFCPGQEPYTETPILGTPPPLLPGTKEGG